MEKEQREQEERVWLRLQKNDVINAIMKQYAGRTPITRKGIKTLYNRAYYRGYQPYAIYTGLKIVICKNYLRSEYQPPNGDIAQEVIHERIYIEDAEFKEIMKEDYICKV